MTQSKNGNGKNCTVEHVKHDTSQFLTNSVVKGRMSSNTGVFIMYSIANVSAKGIAKWKMSYGTGVEHDKFYYTITFKNPARF